MASKSKNARFLSVTILILVLIAAGSYIYGYTASQNKPEDAAQTNSSSNQVYNTELIDETADKADLEHPAKVDSYDTKTKAFDSETTSTAGGITPAQFNGSTHPEGTQNSPYTAGVDGYNYDDPQDYEKQP